MLGQLLPHVRCLFSVPQGGIFDFFSTFRFTDNFESIVHVTLEGVYQVRVLFEFPLPIFHHTETFVGQAGRQSQFQHLDSRCYFHDQPFLFDSIVGRRHAVFHHHSLAGKPLLMSSGTHYLAQGFLHIIVVMVKALLTGHIDGIPVRFIMGHSAAIVTDRHKAVTHLQQKIIESDMHTPCVCL